MLKRRYFQSKKQTVQHALGQSENQLINSAKHRKKNPVNSHLGVRHIDFFCNMHTHPHTHTETFLGAPPVSAHGFMILDHHMKFCILVQWKSFQVPLEALRDGGRNVGKSFKREIEFLFRSRMLIH